MNSNLQNYGKNTNSAPQSFVLRGAKVVDAFNPPIYLDLLILDGKIAGRLTPGTHVDESIPNWNAEGLTALDRKSVV